jgi:hypothetical protein
MSHRVLCALLLGSALAASAFGLPDHHPPKTKIKIDRHDPAFRKGYHDGWQQGAKDAAALSNTYNDQSSQMYADANDGYTHQYGDFETYRKLFRHGYVDGYRDGWNYNAGYYCPFGCAGGGP